jgi:hypothetical protein
MTKSIERRRGLKLMAAAIQQHVIGGHREAKQVARSIRDEWMDALLLGKSVEVPLGQLQVVWRKPDRHPRHRSGVLKQFGRLPSTSHYPNRQLRVAFRAYERLQWDPARRSWNWSSKELDRRDLLVWMPGQACSDAKPSVKGVEVGAFRSQRLSGLDQLRQMWVEKHELGHFQGLDIIQGVCASVRSAVESDNAFTLRGIGTWQSAPSQKPGCRAVHFRASAALLRNLQAAIDRKQPTA